MWTIDSGGPKMKSSADRAANARLARRWQLPESRLQWRLLQLRKPATLSRRLRIREVQVLRRSGRFAAVASGLNQGEAIIAYASDHVGSGVRVALRQPSNLAGDR